jgi:hypothetical protein
MWPRTEPRTLESGSRRSQPHAFFVIYLNAMGYAQIATSRKAVPAPSQVIIKMEGMEALAQICAETDG